MLDSLIIVSLLLKAVPVEPMLIAKSSAFKNPVTQEFGLKDKNNNICLLLKFTAKLINTNLEGSNIATKLPDFTSGKVKIGGYCAIKNLKNATAQFTAEWKNGERRKKLVINIDTASVRSIVQQLKELRWQLKTIIYMESYQDQSVKFESNGVFLSAPLTQKYVCKDRMNISLHNQHFKDYILELEPEIEAQPYRADQQTNVYICEKTRRRTLAESFQNRITVASGVVLCLSSVSTMIGYSVRRQLHPSKRQLYQSLK